MNGGRRPSFDACRYEDEDDVFLTRVRDDYPSGAYRTVLKRDSVTKPMGSYFYRPVYWTWEKLLGAKFHEMFRKPPDLRRDVEAGNRGYCHPPNPPEGRVLIHDNPALTTLEFGDNLGEVGWLDVVANPVLTTFTGGSNDFSTVNHVMVTYNTSIKDCCVLQGFLLEEPPAGDTVIVANNTAECTRELISGICGTGGIGSTIIDRDVELNKQLIIPFLDMLQEVTNGGSVIISGDDVNDISGLQITSIEGDLIIENFNAGDFNLGSNIFSSLETIGGSLIIRNNSIIPEIAAFANLRSIGRNIEIHSNTGMNTINGLGKLTSIGGRLEIYDNSSITSISGFGELNTVGESFIIRDNERISTLTGFDKVTTITETLRIVNMPVTSVSFMDISTIGGDIVLRNLSDLTMISGFDDLNSASSLTISSNPMLQSITGFSMFRSTTQSITLSDNSSISSFPTFPALTMIGGSLEMNENSMLEAFPDFTTIMSIGGSLTARNNTSIVECCALQPLVQLVQEQANAVVIQNNGNQCLQVDFSSCRIFEVTEPTPPGDLIPAGGQISFNIRSNASWKIEAPADATWITGINPNMGEGNRMITVAYSGISGANPRYTTLTITVVDDEGDPIIPLQQNSLVLSQPTMVGGNTEILNLGTLCPSILARDPSAGFFSIESNLNWEIVRPNNSNWITSIEPMGGFGDATVVIKHALNTSENALSAALTIRGLDSNGMPLSISKEIVINQLSGVCEE